MEDFDFNEPVIVEIIYEDSDDDTKPSIHDLHINQAISEGTTDIKQKINLEDLQKTEEELQETANRSFQACTQLIKTEENGRKRKNKDSKLTKTVNKYSKHKHKNIHQKKKHTYGANNKETCDKSKKIYNQANNRTNKFKNVAKMLTGNKHKNKKALDMPSLDVEDLFTQFSDFCKQTETSKLIENNNKRQIDYQNLVRDKDKQDKNNVDLGDESSFGNQNNTLNISVEDYKNTENKNLDVNANSACAPEQTITVSPNITVHTLNQKSLHEISSKSTPCLENKQTHSNLNVQNGHNTNGQNQNFVTSINLNFEDYYKAQINSFNNDSHGIYNNMNKSDPGFLEQMLRTVSEHMICILNEYNVYIHMYKSSRDQDLLYRTRNSFIHTKEHLFDLSYSSVMHIIIPRENDDVFVRSFIDNTIKLAHSKSYRYSAIHVEPLYNEMLRWVKKRKQNVERINKINVYRNQCSYPMITEMLNKSTKTVRTKRPPPPYDHSKMSNTKTSKNLPRVPSVPSFASGHPSSINNHQLYNNQDKERMSNCNAPTEAPITQNPPEHQNYYTEYQRNNIEKIHSSLMALQSQINVIGPIPNSGSSAQQTNCFSQIGVNSRQTYENQQLSYYHNTHQLQREHSRPQVIGAENSTQEQLRREMQTLNQQWPTKLPFEINRSENPVNNSNDKQPVELYRSVSRDSGFMSPLASASEQLCNIQEEPTETTPLITHVTSLNSNADYIAEGSCYVCGNLTKKVCQGCYNSYYCSSECQHSDWNNHRILCRA